jgi:DNA adenine methylase
MLGPLRYPGSKSGFVKIVDRIIRSTGFKGMPLCEPYAGSAAISFGLLKLQTISHATLVERDPLLFAFWKCVFEHTDELIHNFEILPINIHTWHKLRPLLNEKEPTSSNLLELGLAGLFFNRANFSGILNGGPIGGLLQKSKYKIDCRTNKEELVKRIRSATQFSDRVTVTHADAVDFINRHKRRKKILFYIDPPYFNKGELLYRYYYRHRDHKILAHTLTSSKFPWMLSYDSHHVIEFLYEDFFIRRHKFQYSARNSTQNEELLISNFGIPIDIDNWRD